MGQNMTVREQAASSENHSIRTPLHDLCRPPRFLISRMSAIGDTILTMPVACALRASFPNAYIAWVVEEKSSPVLMGHQAVDEVIVLRRKWFTSPKSLLKSRARLRQLQCDVSIDCQGMTKSALAGYLSGAKDRIGYFGPCAREFSRFFTNIRVGPQRSHLTDRSLELLGPLGIDSPQVNWQFPLDQQALDWAKNYRSTLPKQPLAVLNPGATWHSKRWLPERFGETASYLGRRYGAQCVAVWGNELDHQMATQIVDTSHGHAVIAPATNLQQLAALISMADLFISNDTGPLHLSVAVGTPTIGLYGATRPGDSGPYGQVALQKAYEAGSSRERRQASNQAICQISTADVCDAIDRVWDLDREAAA